MIIKLRQHDGASKNILLGVMQRQIDARSGLPASNSSYVCIALSAWTKIVFSGC